MPSGSTKRHQDNLFPNEKHVPKTGTTFFLKLLAKRRFLSGEIAIVGEEKVTFHSCPFARKLSKDEERDLDISVYSSNVYTLVYFILRSGKGIQMSSVRLSGYVFKSACLERKELYMFT